MEEQPNKKLTDQQKGEKVFWVDNFFFLSRQQNAQ